MQASCKKYLSDNNFIYKSKVKIYEKYTPNPLTLDFVIPGAVILLVGTGLQKKIVTIVEKIIKILPENFIIYLYFSKTPVEYILEELSELTKIEIINNFNQIKSSVNEFFVMDSNFFLSMASSSNLKYDNLLQKYDGITFYVSQDRYNFITIMLDEEEMRKLHKFSIKIKEISESDVLLGSTEFHLIDFSKPKYQQFNQIKKIDGIFSYFIIEWDHYLLNSKLPKKHINGITEICKTCSSFCFPKYIKDNKCSQCLPKEITV